MAGAVACLYPMFSATRHMNGRRHPMKVAVALWFAQRKFSMLALGWLAYIAKAIAFQAKVIITPMRINTPNP